ncbi:hypothetical protein DSM100688_1759 [Bifidobacterium ramosum]|uniref:Uncharacterized protein n=1 Tax=Bifidobacterium ramosum TaxID=1798158 RepID=A0A6L4WYJ6_9BIFI|nr:hypothetical protein DSM100688_1759 [Bifidobacterium ramosum]
MARVACVVMQQCFPKAINFLSNGHTAGFYV